VLQTERLRERAELLALARADGFESPAVPRPTPRLDLADHERATAGEHEIELADTTSPIACDDAVAAADVVPFDGRLAATADRDALVHAPKIGFPSDMTELVEIVDGTPSPEEYAAFRAHVRWPAVAPSQAAGALRASLASVLARDVDGALVGMGRVVGDGGVYLYLQDVIVLERWRNNGIGTRITEALLDHVRELGGPGTFVGLMAAVGAGPFYERFGFQPRGEDRPGMWLTL
jgi:GNAT superfamily N-acetyltransferase